MHFIYAGRLLNGNNKSSAILPQTRYVYWQYFDIFAQTVTEVWTNDGQASKRTSLPRWTPPEVFGRKESRTLKLGNGSNEPFDVHAENETEDPQIKFEPRNKIDWVRFLLLDANTRRE